ncbi:MAG: hypothetical protein U0939_26210 [Pirellulales bacterium]
MSRRRSGRARSRRPLGERLECRNLLAGFVHVEFNDGNLFVAGDDAANELRIEQSVGNGTTKEGLRIVPDASTSLNGLPPGVSLELGPTILSSLQIETGAGDDRIALSSLRASEKLVFRNQDGSDALHIVDLDLDGALDVASAAPLYLKVEGASLSADAYIKFGGATDAAAIDRSSLSLDGTHIKGEMRVESTQRLDIKGESSSTGAAFIKFDGIKGEAATSSLPSSLQVESFSWGSSLSVVSNVPSSVSLKDSDCDDARFSWGATQTGSVSSGAGGGAGRSSLSLDGTHIKGEMVVESTRLLDIKGESSSTGAAFIKFDGIKGEATTSSLPSSLQVESFSWGSSLSVVSNVPSSVSLKDSDCDDARFSWGATQTGSVSSGAGGGAGRSSLVVDALTVTASMFVASDAPLSVSIADSIIENDAHFSFMKGRTSRTSPQAFSSLMLEELTIVGSTELHSSQPLTMELHACDTGDVAITLEGADGESRASSITVRSSDIDGEWRFDSTAPSTLDLVDSRVQDGTYLKYELKDILISSFSLRDSDLGPLEVEAAAAVEGTIIDTSVDGDAHFHFAKVRSERLSTSASSSLELEGLTVVGDTELRSSQPISLSASACDFSDIYLKLDGARTSQRGAAVSFDDCVVDGELSVDSSLPLSYEMTASSVYDRLSISISPASSLPNSLSIDQSDVGGLRIESSASVHGELRDVYVEGDVEMALQKIRERPRSTERSTFELDGLTVTGSTEMRSSQPVSLQISSSAFADDVYIKLTGARSELRGAVIDVAGSQLSGALQIESSMSLQFSGDSSTAQSGYLKLDGFLGQSSFAGRGSIVELDRFITRSSLVVESGVPIEMTAASSRVGGDFTLRLDEIFAPLSTTGGRFAARDFVVSGGLAVVGSEGNDALRFEKLQVGGSTDIRLGDGADRCMLVDSLFAGSALLDGGAGTDLLGLPNTTFKRERVLRNWETTVYRDDGK